MQAFIKGVGLISPQHTLNFQEFIAESVTSNTNSLKCIEPSYAAFLNPIMSRRMGRIVKMGMAAASICLKDANVGMPDAIITGTALGCLGDTEKFLTALITDEELYLTPIPFIQSIQNTVGAQIALHLKCMNHNFTHSHKGFSFESAALDALMLLDDGEAKNVLIGGLDEMTPNNFLLFDRINRWKKENIPSLNLINAKTEGTIAGEGAAFFVLSNEENESNYAILKGLRIIYKPESKVVVEDKIQELLIENKLTHDDIDLVLYGINGDIRYDNIHYEIKETLFQNTTSGYFKHLCGEYQTSSGFAMWLSAMILKNQQIPKSIIIDNKNHKSISNILIYNNYELENQTLMLLSKI
jgi:3-oxoacyl-(acyl-carrier-protein) synthase